MQGFKDLQDRAYANKVAKGWNITDIDKEIKLTRKELDEVEEAYHTGSDTVGEELADVAIYLMGIAAILGKDLGEEIEKKICINEGRVYKNKEKTEPVIKKRNLRVFCNEDIEISERGYAYNYKEFVDKMIHALSGIRVVKKTGSYTNDKNFETLYTLEVYTEDTDDILYYLNSISCCQYTSV